MAELLPAQSARSDELEELIHSVRAELLRRGEAPPSSWVQEAARELKAGRITGWYHPGTDAPGLGFFSVRGDRAFGHVHVAPGADAPGRARQLVEVLTSGQPLSVSQHDLGITGLSTSEEQALGESLERTPGVSVLVREQMDRDIGVADSEPVVPQPIGVHHIPIRAVSREALAQLDYLAFHGTIDANLIGTEPAEYRRMMDELVEGRLGRFLEEASTALLSPGNEEIWGALLTSEQSPQLAVYLDVMVHPSHRRKGIGRYLVRWGFRALWALGYTKVRLWVTRSNEPAYELYRTNGFAPMGTALILRYSRPAPPGNAVPPPG